MTPSIPLPRSMAKAAVVADMRELTGVVGGCRKYQGWSEGQESPSANIGGRKRKKGNTRNGY